MSKATCQPHVAHPSLISPPHINSSALNLIYMDSTGLPIRSATLNTSLLKSRLAAIRSSKATDTQQEEDSNCCVICLDQVTEEAQAQPCQHSSFDFICLASWVQERSCCPLCNAEVSSIHYAFNGIGEYKIYPVVTTSRSSSQAPSQASAASRTPVRHLRQRRSNISPRPIQPDEVLERRRTVYRESLYSLHVGSNRISRFRDFTPQTFSSDIELQSRTRKWIRRELRVFEYLYPAPTTDSRPMAAPKDRRANNAEFLLEYVIAILKTVDVQGPTAQATEMLQEFIGREHAMLFLHELRAWVRSPYTALDDWDMNVQYRKDLKRTTEAARAPFNGRGGLDSRVTSRSDRFSPY